MRDYKIIDPNYGLINIIWNINPTILAEFTTVKTGVGWQMHFISRIGIGSGIGNGIGRGIGSGIRIGTNIGIGISGDQ